MPLHISCDVVERYVDLLASTAQIGWPIILVSQCRRKKRKSCLTRWRGYASSCSCAHSEIRGDKRSMGVGPGHAEAFREANLHPPPGAGGAIDHVQASPRRHGEYAQTTRKSKEIIQSNSQGLRWRAGGGGSDRRKPSSVAPMPPDGRSR